MKTRNPSKSLTTCPTMNKIVHFPGISHAQMAQIPGYSQVFAVPGGRKPGLQDLLDLQGIRELRFFTMLWWMKKVDLYGILILCI